MKFRLLLFAILWASSSAFSQDMINKRGVPILPEAGDWAIGFDAMPLLEYLGTIGTGANIPPSAAFVGNQTLWGKYFVADNKAYRGMLRIGFGAQTTTNPVLDDAALFLNSSSSATKIDQRKEANNNNVIGVGLEMRRGKGRVQGFYGGDLLFSTGGANTTYDFGNDFDTSFVASYTSDFDDAITSNSNSRIIEVKEGSTFGVTARGIMGVEYFFAAKISVAAEFGWGIGFASVGAGFSRVEWFDPGTVETKVTTTQTGKTSTFGVDTDNSGGAIRLMFHF